MISEQKDHPVNIARTFAALLLGLSLAVLLGEAVSRAYFWGTASRKTSKVSVDRPVSSYHPLLGWSLVPNSESRFSSEEFDTIIRVNSRGLRHDKEISFSKIPGVYRVLMIGDSLTFGHGVDIGDRFSDRVERLLPGVEAINQGVWGFGTGQQLLHYLVEGVRYSPDLVILCYPINNIDRNGTTVFGVAGGLAAKPAFSLVGSQLKLTNLPAPKKIEEPPERQPPMDQNDSQAVGAPIPFKHFFREHSALYRFLRLHLPKEVLEALRTRSIRFPKYEPSNPSWQLTSALISRLAHEANKNGSDFMLVLLTSSEYIYMTDSEIPPQRLVRQLAEAEQLPYIDLIPDLREAHRAGARLSFALDHHWTPLGHEVAARAIAEEIRTRWLPSQAR